MAKALLSLDQPMRLTHFKCSFFLPRRLSILFGLLCGFLVSLLIPHFNEEKCFSTGISTLSSISFNGPSFSSSSGFQFKPINWFEEIINSDYNPEVKLPITNGSNRQQQQDRVELKSFNSKRPRFVLDELDVNDQLLIVVLITGGNPSNHPVVTLLNETLAPYADRILFFRDSLGSQGNAPRVPPSLPGHPADSRGQMDSQSSLPLVHSTDSIIDLNPSLLSEPLFTRILTYLATSYEPGRVKSYLKGYNHIFFIGDNSHVKGDLLRSQVDRLSVHDHLFAPGKEIGIEWPEPAHQSTCSLLQSSLLSTSPSDYFTSGLLVTSSLITHCQGNIPCFTRACNDSLFNSYRLAPEPSDKLSLDPVLFHSSLVAHPLFTASAFANVHHYHLRVKLNHDLNRLHETEERIQSFVEKHKNRPNHVWTLAWPLGITSSHRPIDRFDVIRWSYHENGIIYMPDDYEVLRKENEDEKVDRETIESLAIKWLTSRYPEIIGSLGSLRVTNVYRRFDPNRGIDYVLDLLIPNLITINNPNPNNILDRDNNNNNYPDGGADKRFVETTKVSNLIPIRIEAVKPLVPMRIVDQIPFATEQNRISVIVPVRSDGEASDTIALMSQYVGLCNQFLSQSQSTSSLTLIIALITHNSSPSSGYGRVMSMGLSLKTKFPTLGCKLLLSTVPREPNENYSTSTDLGLIMLLSKRFPSFLTDSIIILSSSNTLFTTDYLARIQLNTLKGRQVYFPIPFQEYNLRPGPSAASPESLKISKDNGFFNWFDYRHVTFYLDDFKAAFNTVIDKRPQSDQNHYPQPRPYQPSIGSSDDPVQPASQLDALLDQYDLMELFLQFNCLSKSESLHLLRAVEPSLRLHFRQEKCDPEADRYTRRWCNQTSIYSLGNKAQMANLILNYKSIGFNGN